METTPTPQPAAAPQPETRLHFLDYWRIIRVRKMVILTVFLLVVLTTTMVTQFLPPQFESTARIEVEKDIPDIEGLGRSSVGSGFDPYWMQTQFEIIQSSAVLDRVINTLKLGEQFALRDKLAVPYRVDEARLLLKRMLDLNQYRNTSLIEIRVLAQEPDKAAEISNEIAKAYKAYREETRMNAVQKGLKVLQDSLAEAEAKFNDAASNVNALRKNLEITDIDPTGGKSTATMEQESMRRMESYRMDAETEYVRYNEILEKINKMTDAELKHALQNALMPDQGLTVLIEDQTKAEQKRAQLEAELGPEHPQMEAVNNILAKLESQIDVQLKGIRNGLNAKVASLKATYDHWEAKVEAAKSKDSKAGEKMRPYLDAKEERELALQVKTAVSLHLTQVTLDNEKMGVSSVRVVEAAEPGIYPVRPRKVLNIALGVFVGLVLGFGLAFFIEYLDTSVKTIDDVERAFQAPVLGVIPQNVTNLLDEGPESPHAEAYRVLRTNLLFSRKDETWNSITIVSAGAGEGKSTTLFNLAIIFAQNGARVLLVDSDLRRPSLHKRLKVSNSIGLTSYLLKQNKLEEVIQTTGLPTLDFLPSGKLPSSAMGVLNSVAMKELITDLKRRYDFVFFDSPPIMGISDASILASEVDMTMQVIQYRRYPQPMTIRAKQMVEKVGGNLMGIVLNNINMSQDSYYYYYSGYFEEAYYKQEDEKQGKGKGGKGDKGSKTPELASSGGEIKQKY
jgi:polysaccharide biosynthesis transport protein